MQMAEHPCVWTLLQKRDFVIAVTRDIGVSGEAIFQLKRSAALSPPGMISKRKPSSGAPKRTSRRTNKLLKREETSYLSITAAELKASTMIFPTTSQPGQSVVDLNKIFAYHVAVQPRSSCSLQQ